MSEYPPSKPLAEFRSRNIMTAEEQYIGSFMGRNMPRFYWYFLLGPLAAFKLKQYLVVATYRRIFFCRLNLLGKLSQIDEFSYDEISRCDRKRNRLTCRLSFEFQNGRTISLDTNHKGLVKREGFFYTEAIDRFFSEKFK